MPSSSSADMSTKWVAIGRTRDEREPHARTTARDRARRGTATDWRRRVPRRARRARRGGGRPCSGGRRPSRSWWLMRDRRPRAGAGGSRARGRAAAATPYSISPSGWPRNSTVVDARRSRRSPAPRPRGHARTPPGSSVVDPGFAARRRAGSVTRLPCAVQRATAAAAPYSMSSGWATIASARSQSSGTGSIDSRRRRDSRVTRLGRHERDRDRQPARLVAQRRDPAPGLRRVLDRPEPVAEQPRARVEIGDGRRRDPRAARRRRRSGRRAR